ncbi:gamma carbonic anhydrase family protein [Streptomyces sp. YC504]|uniref:Gamma carbonic anhydrase family protein n=1 Tax=Streptomyces mesophilus TaxID=1775132 RepID=A0A6G4XDZ8_9ACTN|nr:gamma carbonic anhydrase family protein [Streptomyces mesophilus]NGO75786.1 gamma carbonic anhydrase family protein [Streptomyces mesophilus]
MAVYALGDQVPQIHPEAFVHPAATVIGSVRIGEHATVWPSAVLRGDFGTITIGDRTSVQDGVVLHADDDWPTRIGADCVIGHLAHLEGCTVGDGCLIGAGAVVLKGAVIGAGALIGAAALVTEHMAVPPRAQALGVPARLTGRTIEPGAFAEGAAKYVANGRRYRTHLRRLG